MPPKVSSEEIDDQPWRADRGQRDREASHLLNGRLDVVECFGRAGLGRRGLSSIADSLPVGAARRRWGF
jgi:hypothetical protein